MSYRRFTDGSGRVWEAWEVHPAAVERRVNAERRRARRIEPLDRRSVRDLRLVIPRELRDGWLACQGTAGKLRIAPIPDGWVHLSDEQLGRLVARSQRTRSAS